MQSQGSGGFSIGSAGGYLTDAGFWISVVAVNVLVAIALVLLKAPGYRR